MSVNTKHPEYIEFFPEWELMRDLFRGESAVKARRQKYLPPTSSMIMDGVNIMGAPGYNAYNAYLERAVFPDYVRSAVQTLGGLLHQKPATIELPKELEPLREHATKQDDSLQVLLRLINEKQLVEGRLGLLADFPKVASDRTLPFISVYDAFSIINWDGAEVQLGQQSLNLVVLDECHKVREGFTWSNLEQFRVLSLGDFVANEWRGTYYMEEYVDGNIHKVTPTYLGAPSERIPFVFINSNDLEVKPDQPALASLARISLAVYRGEADYRQNLFMQGQDTLVVKGRVSREQDGPLRTGAGAMLELDVDGDAKYIGVNSSGLLEQREALNADRKRAELIAGNLIDASQRTESGLALQTRIGAQTATLTQIALAGAAGLERLLRIVAEWVGANPEDVVVKPNLEFADYGMTGQELTNLMAARSMGAPISLRSIHTMMEERGLTKFDFDTEMGVLEQEAAQELLTIAQPNVRGNMGPAPDDSEPDPQAVEPPLTERNLA